MFVGENCGHGEEAIGYYTKVLKNTEKKRGVCFVTDSLKALELYEKIFEVERIEVTDFPKGENKVVFSLYGVRFHMLDENLQFQMIAPKPSDPKTYPKGYHLKAEMCQKITVEEYISIYETAKRK